jgi:hypothetical protein
MEARRRDITLPPAARDIAQAGLLLEAAVVDQIRGRHRGGQAARDKARLHFGDWMDKPLPSRSPLLGAKEPQKL